MEQTSTDRVTDPMLGRLLDGRYQILERIARGGMATVYEAIDRRLDRPVAIKVMHPGLGDDQEFARRFQREAQAAARLSHHNVVAVHDQGDDDGVLFLVMEHVPGITLRDLIRNEAPMPAIRALTVIEPVLSALQAAHDAGMMHRDVKPENVLLSPDGRVKVADFGLARAVNADTHHTNTGVLIGTVSYLAPELVVGGDPTPRADVYAAGVLLYEMLVGTKPHRADTPIQVAYKHVHEDVSPPSDAVPTLPAYVDALVARATARDPALRAGDGGVLLRQVRRVRAALEAGVVDDPELVADLTPYSAGSPHRAEPFADTDGQMPAAVIDPSEEFPAVRDDTHHTEVLARGSDADGFFDQDPLPVVGADDRQGWAPEPEDGPTDQAPDGRGDDEDHGDQRDQDDQLDSYYGMPETGEYDPTFTDDRIPVQSGGRHGAYGGDPGVPVAHRTSGGAVGQLLQRPEGVAPLEPPSRRRRRGRLLVLVAVLVVALVVALGTWWFGFGRWSSTPGVVNMSVADAQKRVERDGLVFKVADQSYSEAVAKGSVISTRPKPGERLLDGATVSAVVSLGPERHAVPAVVGKTLDQAQQLIVAAKLTYGKQVGAYSEKVAKGKVISASPAVGTSLKRNTPVDLVVSRGRKPIQVPSYVGDNAATAEAGLEKLGLKVSNRYSFNDDVAKGRVITQDPRNGTRFKGDTVTLTISKGVDTVTMPNVVSKKDKQAVKLVRAAGLKPVVARSPQYVGLNAVTSTNPPPGARLKRGTTVYLYLI